MSEDVIPEQLFVAQGYLKSYICNSVAELRFSKSDCGDERGVVAEHGTGYGVRYVAVLGGDVWTYEHKIDDCALRGIEAAIVVPSVSGT